MATYKWDPTTGMYILSDDQSSFALITNQPDYSPGQTVQITATFDPLSTVQFTVAHDIGAGADGIWGTADDVLSYDLTGTGLPWTVTADASGLINTSWFVNLDALGQAFELIAVEQALDGTFTGPTVMMSFTDGLHAPVPALPSAPIANGIEFLTGDTTTSSGTGIFPAFVQIQASPADNGVEQGFNTDFRPPPVEDTGNALVHNHSITLGTIPIVTDGDGNQFREFRLDLNESQSSTAVAQIVLEALQIFKQVPTGDPTVDGHLSIFTPFAGGTTGGSLTGASEIYNMDGGLDGNSGTAGDNLDVSVLLQSWATGSGHSDYKVLIPESFFASLSDSDFIYLYSKFSGADGGFEEWSVATANPVPPPPPPTPHAELLVTKDTLCADGDSIADQIVLKDNPISWTYTIQNIGDDNSFVSTLTLSDDKLGTTIYDPAQFLTGNHTNPALGVVTFTGDNGDGILQKGETWVFTVSGTSGDGFYQNTATVTGTGGNTTNTNTDPGLEGFGTSDYTGATASVTLDKLVSGNGTNYVESGHANYTGAPVILAAYVDGTGTHSTNAQVFFKATVKNTTDAALNLSVTSVTDVNPNGTFTGPATLAQNESEDYLFQTTAVAGGTQTDTATVNGTVSDNCDNSANVSASDTAQYVGATAGINIEKLVSVNGGLDWYFTVVAGDTYDTIPIISGLTGIDASHLHIGTPSTIAGAQVKYEVVVSNTSTGGLGETISSLTDSTGLTFTFGTSTLTASGTTGDHELSNVVTTTAGTGSLITNTVTVTGTVSDSFGNTAHPSDTDSANFTGLAPSLPGLTKGFWGTHFTIWDSTTTDDGNQFGTGIAGTTDLNSFYGHTQTSPFAATILHSDGINWNKDLAGVDDSALISGNGSTNGQVDVSHNANGGGDYGLLLGDLNHDGLPNDGGGDLYFDLASAQALLNSSVVGDARIILAGQALAAQLNEYNDYVYDQTHGGSASTIAEPNGLIEAAVQWLEGLGPLSPTGHSNVDTNISNDVTVGLSTIKTVASDAAGVDYTIKSGAITLGAPADSSSDGSWNLLLPNMTTHLPGSAGYMPTVLSGYTDINGHTINVVADGEGLKNALAAFDHGLTNTTAGFVVSTDGTTIGWQDSLGGTPYDVHPNDPGAFWGILEDQNILHPNSIVGVAVATGTIV